MIANATLIAVLAMIIALVTAGVGTARGREAMTTARRRFITALMMVAMKALCPIAKRVIMTVTKRHAITANAKSITADLLMATAEVKRL